jgi:hypothetical protein
MDFGDYIESLATLHSAVRHSKERCHFSRLIDDSQSKMASTMHYPCVVVDSGDFAIAGTTGNEMVQYEYTLLFLEHVADTRSEKLVVAAFDLTRPIMLDFAARMVRDRQRMMLDKSYAFLRRIDLIGSEGHRIYLKDAGLYGWALFLRRSDVLVTKDCNKVFTDNL